MNIDVYTDGACSGNPGPGGYAFVLNAQGNNMKVWGWEENTTNNRMELMAIVYGLRQALSIRNFSKEKKCITIYSDSAYCVEAINQGWFIYWASNEWCKKDGEKVKNADLWEKLYDLISKVKQKKYTLKFVKVKGHSGDPMNELVDSLAKMAIKDLNASKAPSKR